MNGSPQVTGATRPERLRYQRWPGFACVSGALLLLACSPWSLFAAQITAAVEPSFGGLESEIAAEINRLRADPNGYATKFEAWKPLYHGQLIITHRDGQETVEDTQEGLPALEEAISALRSARRMRALSISKSLVRAARDHVKNQGPSGQTGHNDTDGRNPSARVGHYTPGRSWLAENISYGRWTAEDLVRHELVDDGIRDRGHRQNLLNRDFYNIGVACGKHAKYGIMCVLDFATEF